MRRFVTETINNKLDQMIPYLSHPCFSPLLLLPPPPDLGMLSVGGNNLSKPKNKRRCFTNTVYFIMPETYLGLSSYVFIDLSHVVPLFHFLCMLDPQPFVSVLPWHSRAVLSAPVLYKFTTLYCYTYYCYSTKILTKFINFLQRYQDRKKICDLLFTPDIGFFTQLEQK